ncbi:MAG: 5-formyltetrahydrofolate cyclo-ligase [Gammaproteobacteria bacterium TMED1]|nr:MAG: 5-formyltetrahydrofolate cyclo-ligase [Gammaproteobacteria bacterium TMED1]
MIIQINKNCLRKSLRKHRQALSLRTQKETSKKITRLISNRLFFQRASNLAFYLPFDGEVNPMGLCSLANNLGKKCFLPQITDKTLIFKYFIPDRTELQKNGFNIFEPVSTESIPVETLDVVFMPLVAFDKHGNRIGMGKGYYDQTFSEKSKWRKKPLLIGIAHSFQEANLQPHPKDVPMDGVVTELGFICCRKNDHITY